MSHIGNYPYILFIWAFVGVALKLMWTITTTNISKDVEFVRHGIEEEVSELIQRLRKKFKTSSFLLKHFFCNLNIWWCIADAILSFAFENCLKVKMQKIQTLIITIVPTDFHQRIRIHQCAVSDIYQRIYVQRIYVLDSQENPLLKKEKIPFNTEDFKVAF